MEVLNICILVGARPNFVKVAPLVRVMTKARANGLPISHKLVYVGSKDDSLLEDTLFSDLEIDYPDKFLSVDSQNLNELTGRVISKFDSYLESNPTDVVIVVDDLASTMAAAIVTKKRGLTLAHLVAGTRSFDINMPKEINRLVIDGLSDYLFTAGVSGKSIVSREKPEVSNVFMVGNILMDTLRYSRSKMVRPKIMDELNLKGKDYFVFTINRKALLRDEKNLCDMISRMCSASGDVMILAPLREEAENVIGPMVKDNSNFKILPPLSYLDFGYLTSNALGIITDSGNVAEEATFNGVPCATLNSYTEHIETVTYGSNVLVGEDPEKLALAIGDMISGNWKKSSLPDYWDGHTAERILQILLSLNQT